MMPAQPPPGCIDPRLWATAYELAQQHASDDGRCLVCASPWPCRKAEAAEDAMSRAMPPPLPPVDETPPPAPESPPPVGARFPRERHVGRRRRSG